jgi:hypothetical protein
VGHVALEALCLVIPVVLLFLRGAARFRQPPRRFSDSKKNPKKF